jgi:glycosyltransferase involved in cell wall biosynthesis
MQDRRRVAVTLEQCWHAVPGGTATSALHVTRALAARGDLDLVGVSARHRQPPPVPWTPPIPTRALPLPRLALYEAWHLLRHPHVERATGPVDAIYVTGVAVPPRTAPLVITVHDLAFLRRPEHFTAKGRRFFRQALDLAKRDGDLVLCPSEATRHDCEAHGFDPGRLRVVPWGVDQGAVAAADVARARAAYGLEKPYVLSVGTAEPRKNLEAVVAGYAGLQRQDVDLAVVGPPGWYEDLGHRVAALGDRVHRLGFVPDADLRALYAGATVFCYPSLWEGFGLPVLEAMAQGTPVVTSAGTAMAEITGDAASLVEPTDHGAVTDALAAVLADEPRARALGEAGRKRAAEFTWERTADLVAAAIEEATAS